MKELKSMGWNLVMESMLIHLIIRDMSTFKFQKGKMFCIPLLISFMNRGGLKM